MEPLCPNAIVPSVKGCVFSAEMPSPSVAHLRWVRAARAG